jgi:hypothetical protein
LAFKLPPALSRGPSPQGPDAVLFSDPLERLELATSLAGADQLADSSARFRQEIRRVKPAIAG